MMQGNIFTVNSETTLGFCQKKLAELFNEKKWFQIQFNFDKQRSDKQNSALHVYCRLLAQALNEAGYSYIVEINGKRSKIDWSMYSVKSYMWKPIQQAIANKDSSTKCSTKDYPEIYENLNRLTAERFGVSVAWPTKEAV
jgi:hypothetical protein